MNPATLPEACNPIPTCQDTEQIDIVVLGAPSVGKTALIEQYIRCQFTKKHKPTKAACVYTSAMISANKIYEMNIVDMPVIPFSPHEQRQIKKYGIHCSWDDLQAYAQAIGSASALIFVYDITSSESFQYIKDLREQILDCYDSDGCDIPMIIAGNKNDLHYISHLPRKHISQIVKKTWKCGYVECSAKYNCHVASLFNDVVRIVDQMSSQAKESQAGARRIPLRAWRSRNCSCTIM
ncbi:ras-like protein family member 10B [Amphiura filiformis]|uniref:ras-like protein family member 10B n=1 Tax=Amphiura filiformis TaxID=82378 RepID=UPI003B20C862